ncbi:MAG: hypothetical protein JSW00_03625 [Thermoplasmata archaeon]|nr:MAG: hypothetical protein JSW00_03625 [Thermoplasmata archaeon]
MVLLVIYKINIIRRYEIIPLFVVALTHIIADIFFGGFALLAPISYQEVGIFAWGSYFNMSVEIVLFAIMMVVLIYTGDLRKLGEVSFLKKKERRGQRIFQNFVLVIFILVTLGQIGTVIYLDFLQGPNFYNELVYNDKSMWYISFLFMVVQIIFLFILLKWARDRFKKPRSMVSNS